MRTWLAGAAALLVLGLMAPPAIGADELHAGRVHAATRRTASTPRGRVPRATPRRSRCSRPTATRTTTPLQSCPDGGTFGRTLWMAVHPHAAGSFALVVIGLDARMVIEDVATGQRICSDDSFDEGDTRGREALAVRGLEAGKTYLVQIGGRTRQSSLPSTGAFGFQGGFVEDSSGGGIRRRRRRWRWHRNAGAEHRLRQHRGRSRSRLRRHPRRQGQVPGRGHARARHQPGRLRGPQAPGDRRQVADRAHERARDHHARAAAERRAARARRSPSSARAGAASRRCGRRSRRLNVSAKKLRAGRLKPGTTIDVQRLPARLQRRDLPLHGEEDDDDASRGRAACPRASPRR